MTIHGKTTIKSNVMGKAKFVKLGVDLTFKTPRFPKLYKLFWGEGFTFAVDNIDSSFFKCCQVHIKIVEKAHICPFCGQEVHGLHCTCDEFNKYFELLQEQIKHSNNDSDESCLDMRMNVFSDLMIPDNTGIITIVPINVDDVCYEINQVLTCERHNGKKKEKFQISVLGTEYDQENVTFYLSPSDKDVIYKATANVPYKPVEVEIGRWGMCSPLVTQDNSIEVQPPFYGYKTYASWDELCNALLQLAAE